MSLLSCILLVDDDTTTNYLNQRLLQRIHVTDNVLVAVNGKQALDLIHENCEQPDSLTCPALILLDMKMPLMNGVEFLQAFTQRPPTRLPAVVIIMLTTSLNPLDVAQMQNLPIAGYLTKPLTTEKINGILEQHFGYSHPAAKALGHGGLPGQ